jgi:hypothetical protein
MAPYTVHYKLAEPASRPDSEPVAPERTAGPFASRDKAEDFAVAIAPRAYWVRIVEDTENQERRT